MSQGYLAVLLHAHLPYVRHPEHANFLEENWLFEAVTECYLPLLQMFDRLRANQIPFRLTLSLSPTLITMLRDELLQQRYLEHMGRLLALARRETRRKHADYRTQALAEFYLQHFESLMHSYQHDYQGDLISAFGRLQQSGHLELITTAATHGFLPLLRTEPGSVRAQLQVGAAIYQETFGRPSPGIWLPECGYFPGVEEILADEGFRYFVVDTHGLLNADEKPWHGIAAPLACPNGVAAFGRDPDASRAVWSASEGYPGDPWYREFHRDIGFDRPESDLEGFLAADGARIHTGIKYFRVTHQGEFKQPYEPQRASERTVEHAKDFLSKRQAAVRQYSTHMDRPAMLLTPYDAELFGHWWYEGPLWLEQLFTQIQQQRVIEPITPFDYLLRHPTMQSAQPSASSWGELGYNLYWLNEHNDWIYPHLHRAARTMQQMAITFRQETPGSLHHRALQQAGRSLLLAQASDWPFILKTGASASYAEKRVRELISRFNYLANALTKDEINPEHLRALEHMDAIFPHLDFRSFINQE